MERSPEPLDYARRLKKPSIGWRRPVICIALCVIFLVAMDKLRDWGVVGYFWWRHRQAVALTSKLEQPLLNYQPTVGTVMFDDGPQSATMKGPEVVRAVGQSGFPATGFGIRPAIYDQWYNSLKNSDWQTSLMLQLRGPIVFMHERRRPDGAARIVLVTVRGLDSETRWRVIEFNLVTPGANRTIVCAAPAGRCLLVEGREHADILPANMPMTIFAGTADAADSTHLAIPIALGATSVQLDVRLDNLDRFKFSPSIGTIVQDSGRRFQVCTWMVLEPPIAAPSPTTIP